MVSKFLVLLCLLVLGLPQATFAAVPVKPGDDAETIERINTYNSEKTDQAKEIFRNRVLGTRDDSKDHENDTPKSTRSAPKKVKQEHNKEKQELRVQKRESQAADRKEKQGDRCEHIEAKINNRINRYEDSIDKHTARFNATQQKLLSMISVLEEENCDVSQLSSLVADLETKIAELSALYRTFISELQGSRSLVCGERPSEFTTMVNSSNIKLTALRRHANDMSKFIKDEIKPAFRASAAYCLTGDTKE